MKFRPFCSDQFKKVSNKIEPSADTYSSTVSLCTVIYIYQLMVQFCYILFFNQSHCSCHLPGSLYLQPRLCTRTVYKEGIQGRRSCTLSLYRVLVYHHTSLGRRQREPWNASPRSDAHTSRTRRSCQA